MKLFNISLLALASFAVAAPTAEAATEMTSAELASAEMALLNARQSGLDDADILNFALTLEHLEKAFYDLGLKSYPIEDFNGAGYSPRLRRNIHEIASDEATHVSTLEAALAAYPAPAVPACTYDFGLTDVKSFMALAGILEGVGVTAYLGAAHLISNPAYVTAAGSILTIEARHSAYIRDSQLKTQSPFPMPFDVPQSVKAVYSLASQFITTCPPAADLGVTAFPLLTLRPGQRSPLRAGMWVILLVGKGARAVDGKTYAYFAGPAGAVPAEIEIPTRSRGKHVRVKIPDGVAGQSYVSLVNTADPTKVTDGNTIAGPAIVMVQSPYTYGGFPMA